jgi:hypothetical protein
MKNQIFVEGIAEEKFMSDFLIYRYSFKTNKESIISTNGWTNIYSEKANASIINGLKRNTDEGGNNLLVFDADADYISRKEEILAWKKNNKLEFELFLFPNDKSVGDLEILLENIINPVNQPIFDCWEMYENCISKINNSSKPYPLNYSS